MSSLAQALLPCGFQDLQTPWDFLLAGVRTIERDNFAGSQALFYGRKQVIAHAQFDFAALPSGWLLDQHKSLGQISFLKDRSQRHRGLGLLLGIKEDLGADRKIRNHLRVHSVELDPNRNLFDISRALAAGLGNGSNRNNVS